MKVSARFLVALAAVLIITGACALIDNQLFGLPMFMIGFGILFYMFLKLNESDPQ